MTTQATAQRIGTTRKALLVSLALGTAMAATVALVGVTAWQADAASPEKIAFVSARTTGKGVDNPTGDTEIFSMNPNGTGLKQLTFNQVADSEPILSPDGQKIAYQSEGGSPSNSDGDGEVYVMSASDGSGNTNLSNNGADVEDSLPEFSPDSKKISYQSFGAESSNPEGDGEVYVVNVDGTGKRNLSDNAFGVNEYAPDFSPDGQKIAYGSAGVQTSNPEGDYEVYVMNALDGSGKQNLTNSGPGVNEAAAPHFSPDGTKIAYTSRGIQPSNPEGDDDIYLMYADGTGQKNLSNNDGDNEFALDFSPDGTKIAFQGLGDQGTNPEGDPEIYVMHALDGSGKKNLTNNGANVEDYRPDFSPDGLKIVYTSVGKQSSNADGDYEVYRMDAQDGSSKKNLTNNNGFYDVLPDWGR